MRGFLIYINRDYEDMEEILMRIDFKIKYRVIFIAILMNVGFNVLALPEKEHVPKKTWTKDTNGRVLIYRAEPSTAEWAFCSAFTAIGLGVSSVGFWPGISPYDRLPLMICFGAIGSLITIPSAVFLKKWYDEYNSLHKPLIIIDKFGITYEGKNKILWKNVCDYRPVERVIYGDGPADHFFYLEISTDVDRLEIYENKIAITWQMLYKLVDEAYKSYQNIH